jgi:hypothetical protein
MPSDHHLTGKQQIIALAIGGVILAALLGPAAYREMFIPSPPYVRVILLVCIPLAAVIGAIALRSAMGLISAAFLGLLSAAIKRLIPKSVLARLSRVADRRLPPVGVVLMFVGLIVFLLVVFRDPVAVAAGLLVIGALLGIPILLNKVEQWVWRAILRHRAKGAVEESSRREDSPPTLDKT